MIIKIEKGFKKGKIFFKIDISRITFEIGYFRGDDFVLFNTSFLKIWNSDFIEIFKIQIAKFIIDVNYIKKWKK